MTTSCIDVIKKYLRSKPTLCKIVSSFYYSIPFHWLQYKLTIICQKPYFGPVLNANQQHPDRIPVMRRLIEQELDRKDRPDYKILEIGSWGGQSTVLWASVCKKKKKGMVFCIDAWQASSNASCSMKRASRNNRIFNLFSHNIKASGLEDYIVILKGSSDTISEILKSDTFDFVYIDGDHAYSQFKRDLLNYMRVVKINGILCGDDLELFTDEIDILNAKNRCEEDYILDPKSKKYFHPGVTLAINEVFGKVSMKNGFWAMRKTKDGWNFVNL